MIERETPRQISEVERQYLAIKRGEIVEQIMLSSLVVERDNLPDKLVERHKKIIVGALEMSKRFGFKPSDICREVDGLLHPTGESLPNEGRSIAHPTLNGKTDA